VYGWTGQNFMLRILALARQREELQVVDDQLVAPTPASTIADATVAVVGRVLMPERTGGAFGTYHLTSAGATSWFGFAARVLALDPSRTEQRTKRLLAVSSEEFPAAARRPRNGVLNIDKLAQAFGVALPDWETELRRTLAVYANRS
jgi:dTDP-4-dehydrorhamnose reductase